MVGALINFMTLRLGSVFTEMTSRQIDLWSMQRMFFSGL